MAVSSPVLREFIRKVYRAATLAGETNDEYLDGLSDAALTALQSGKTLSASSGNGTSAAYQVFYGFDPANILEMVDQARTPCEEDTATLAIATIKQINRLSSSFSIMQK